MRRHTAPQSIGKDEHLVIFESPGAPVPDGEGGFTDEWTPLDPPTWYVRIRPATARDQEDVIAGTVLTHVSHLVHGRFHPQVTTRTRMIWQGQHFAITGVENVDMRSVEMNLVAELQAPDAPDVMRT